MNPPKLEDIYAIGFVILYALLLLVPSSGIYKIFRIKIPDGDEGMMFNVGKALAVLALLGVKYAIIMELLKPAIEKMNKDK